MFTKWIRRSALIRLVGSLLALGLLLVTAIGGFGPFLAHTTFGTSELKGDAAVAKLNTPDSEGDYFDVSGDATLDTGVQNVRVDENGKVISTESQIVALSIGNAILLVNVENTTDATHFRGRAMPVSDKLYAKLTADLDEATRQRILPLTLDATSDWKLVGTIWFVVVVLATLFLVAVAVRMILRYRNPTTLKGLKGNDQAAALLAAIDSDIAQPGALIGKHAAVGGAFLVTSRPAFTQLSDIVWIYKKVTTKKAYGVVKTGQVTQTMVELSSGKPLALSVGIEDPFLPENLARYVPWAYYGFSAELAHHWKDPNGRLQMIAATAAKRAELRGGV